MFPINALLWLSLSLLALAVGALLYSLRKSSHSIAQILQLEERLKAREQELEQKNNTLTQKDEQLHHLQSENTRHQLECARLETTLSKEKEQAAERDRFSEESREKHKLEFQQLAQRIFEDKSQKFTDQNKTNLDRLLSPLREQIKDFARKVDHVYDKDSKERLSLKEQILHLKTLNERISTDAVRLTNALKGETKTQGIWGEVVLERVLELSGLHSGREYEAQPSHHAHDGKLLRPDVVVHLPEGKDIVIDAKVSLTAYERYAGNPDAPAQAQALKEHLLSLRNHIKQLGEKNYQHLPGLQTLNYVLLFIPIESAFLLAIEKDRELFRQAFDKNIILVSPSTLLAILRTIQSLWQYEHQNRNAQHIAEKAGRLYDKFVAFIQDMGHIGHRLDQAQNSWAGACKKLSEGSGNLVKRSEELRKLGIKHTKTLPPDLNKQPDSPDSPGNRLGNPGGLDAGAARKPPRQTGQPPG